MSRNAVCIEAVVREDPSINAQSTKKHVKHFSENYQSSKTNLIRCLLIDFRLLTHHFDKAASAALSSEKPSALLCLFSGGYLLSLVCFPSKS